MKKPCGRKRSLVLVVIALTASLTFSMGGAVSAQEGSPPAPPQLDQRTLREGSSGFAAPCLPKLPAAGGFLVRVHSAKGTKVKVRPLLRRRSRTIPNSGCNGWTCWYNPQSPSCLLSVWEEGGEWPMGCA